LQRLPHRAAFLFPEQIGRKWGDIVKRTIEGRRMPEAPGGGFAALYLLLYGLVGAVLAFAPAYHWGNGNTPQAAAWAVWGGIMLVALRHGQRIHERALSPYLVDDVEEVRAPRPAPVTIRAWQIDEGGRSARPLPDHESGLADDVWRKAAGLAARGLPITRTALGISGYLYQRLRQELEQLGHMEAGQITPAGIQWLAGMYDDGEAASATIRPIDTPDLRSGRSRSDRPGTNGIRPAHNGAGQGGQWATMNASAPALPALPDWVREWAAPLLVAATMAGAVVRWLMTQTTTQGADAGLSLALALIVIGAVIVAVTVMVDRSISADTGHEVTE
jgi:type III secretory pathway component EscS